jgi:outer membrane lipase/esterase
LLSGVFNQSLLSQLGQIDAEIIPLNVPLLSEALASPASSAWPPARTWSVPATAAKAAWKTRCTASTAPPDPTKLLFNDLVHPTIAGQQLIADYAYSILSAPWELTLLPEMAHTACVPTRMNCATSGEHLAGRWPVASLCRHGARTWTSTASSAASGDGRGYNLTVGGSYRLNDAWRLGLAGGVPAETGSRRARLGLHAEQLPSAFAQYRQDRWWAGCRADRRAPGLQRPQAHLRPGVNDRSEKGDTDGEAWAMSGRLGYNLAADSSNWQLAPFISADYARVKVDGYDEKKRALDGAGLR